MAGGGYGRGTGVPLGERRRAGDPRAKAPATPAEPDAPLNPEAAPPCPARHVWVAAPVDGPVARAGLLLEWRMVGHRWEGRVVYAAQLRPGRWAIVEEWVAADLLAPG